MAFYTEVKNRTKFFPVQEVFDYLAKEEVKHQRTFEALLEKVDDEEPAKSYPGESQMYLQAIAGENVFTPFRDKSLTGFTKADAIKQLAQKASSNKEAIDLGIVFEKDSIIFFGEVKKFVPAADQNMVEKVIGEEREHLFKLLELKKKT